MSLGHLVAALMRATPFFMRHYMLYKYSTRPEKGLPLAVLSIGYDVWRGASSNLHVYFHRHLFHQWKNNDAMLSGKCAGVENGF